MLSKNFEDREFGCNTIANEVESSPEESLVLLKKNNILQILVQLIVDSNFNVRVSAIGALINISTCCGDVGNEELISQDIVKILISFLNATKKIFMNRKLEGTEFSETTEYLKYVFQLLKSLW